MEDLNFSKFEYISPDGLRLDGRRTKETRLIDFGLNMFSKADGSCFFKQGNTKVIAFVNGPNEIKQRGNAFQEKCKISCSYSISKFSTGTRLKRSSKIEKEQALVVRQTFEKVIFVDYYPKTEISITIKVIEDDGSVLPAAINATTLALMDAGIPIKDTLVCCSAGVLEKEIVCDSNHLESSAGAAQLIVSILPNNENKIALIQTKNLNKKTVSLNDFESLMGVGINGCLLVYDVIKKKMKEYTSSSFKKRIVK